MSGGNPAQLRRIHFWRPDPGGTKPIIWANQAGWAFRQRPCARHAENGKTGFEIETLLTAEQALAVLQDATGTTWDWTIVWQRPAMPGDGEGPIRDDNPWTDDGRLTDR